MVNWNHYPTSGRTQSFAGSYCQRPCGVGYGYVLKTTGASGIYWQFNFPIVAITTNEVDTTRLVWESEGAREFFQSSLAIIRDTNPTTKVMEWQIECNNTDPDKSIRAAMDQVVPNLRLRFTMPPAVNQAGDPIENCPNLWTITPLTREQVNEYLAT